MFASLLTEAGYFFPDRRSSCIVLKMLQTKYTVDRFQSRGQQLWNKRNFITCEKSSIPTGCFLYTNTAADSLFCTQIWPP